MCPRTKPSVIQRLKAKVYRTVKAISAALQVDGHSAKRAGFGPRHRLFGKAMRLRDGINRVGDGAKGLFAFVGKVRIMGGEVHADAIVGCSGIGILQMGAGLRLGGSGGGFRAGEKAAEPSGEGHGEGLCHAVLRKFARFAVPREGVRAALMRWSAIGPEPKANRDAGSGREVDPLFAQISL